MKLSTVVPAAMLVASAVGTLVSHETPTTRAVRAKRQLSGLTDILQLVKGIVSQGREGNNDATTTTAAAAAAADTGPASSCAAAISKIDNALTLSESFMLAAGGKLGLRQIVAVLVTLERSLSQCSDGDGIDGIDDSVPGGGDSIQGSTNGSTGIGSRAVDANDRVTAGKVEDDGSAGDNYGQMDGINCANAEDVKQCVVDALRKMNTGGSDSGKDIPETTPLVTSREPKKLLTRAQECTECERGLYEIVKQLRRLFTMSSNASTPAVTDEIQGAIEKGMNSTGGIGQHRKLAGQLQRQAVAVKMAAVNGAPSATPVTESQVRQRSSVRMARHI